MPYYLIDMMIEFKINKIALATDLFAFHNKWYRQEPQKSPFPSWFNLEKELEKKFRDEPGYYLINPNPQFNYFWALKEFGLQFEEKGFQKTFLDVSKKIEKIYQEILRNKKFKKILAETEKYRDWVEKEWRENEKFILNYFKNTLGLKIPNYKIVVYIFHSDLYNGHSDYRTKTILWGHSEEWKNYSVVYLTHEILHILIGKKYGNYDLMHAIIELSTNNELRIRLNKKGVYFKEGKSVIIHSYLRDLEKKILPFWKEYLKNRKERNIFNLEKELEKYNDHH